MTVDELIGMLKREPADTPVFIAYGTEEEGFIAYDIAKLQTGVKMGYEPVVPEIATILLIPKM